MQRIKSLLRKRKIVFPSHKTRTKIKIHGLDPDYIIDLLKNHGNDIYAFEEQPKRRFHDITLGLWFFKAKRKRIFITITYNKLKRTIYIITAFPEHKKMEKLVKRAKFVRR